MRKRKLITQPTLFSMLQETDKGVPVARTIRNHDIDMSRPAVDKLLRNFDTALTSSTDEHVSERLISSLFPDWLTKDCQEQPDDVDYSGYFPLGRWVTK